MNGQNLDDFSEKQEKVEVLRTTEGLMNNYHKTTKTPTFEIIQVITHSI